MPALTAPGRTQDQERRTQAERRRYQDDLEASREAARRRKQRQRHALQSGMPPALRPAGFDPADYAEEFEYLTRAWRMSSKRIISGSDPSYDWFRRHVLPLVHAAVCGTCARAFDPQEAGSLVRCSKTCGLSQPPARGRATL